MLIEVTEEVKDKLKLLVSVMNHPKMTEFNKSFVYGLRDKKSITPKQLLCIEKMFDEIVKGYDSRTFVEQRRGRAYILKITWGWQLYVDEMAVGGLLTEAEAQLICLWIGTNIHELEQVLKEEKPIIEENNARSDFEAGDTDSGDRPPF